MEQTNIRDKIFTLVLSKEKHPAFFKTTIYADDLESAQAYYNQYKNTHLPLHDSYEIVEGFQL